MHRYTSFPMIAHATKELAYQYYSNPLAYHKNKIDVVLISCKEPFLNSHGLWQTNAEIKHN